MLRKVARSNRTCPVSVTTPPALELTVTDTVPLRRTSDRIEVISVAPLIADAINRIYADESISTLFAE